MVFTSNPVRSAGQAAFNTLVLVVHREGINKDNNNTLKVEIIEAEEVSKFLTCQDKDKLLSIEEKALRY